MDSFNFSQGRLQSQTMSGHQTQGYQNIGNVTIPLGKGTSVLELKPGDTFQGEIMSVGGEEVQLKLANGQLLAARLEGNIQLAIGQILGFQVQSNEDAKIVLKPVYQNPMQMQVGEAALKMAGIAVNQKNMHLVTAMIEKGLPIDKNNIQTVYRQVLQHPQEKMETILQLNKLQLPVTETNLRQCESYQNMNYQIQSAASDVTKTILEVYLSLREEAGQQQSQVMQQQGQETQAALPQKTQQTVEQQTNEQLAIKESAQTEVTDKPITQVQIAEVTDRPVAVQIPEVLSTENSQTADRTIENEVHQALSSDGTNAEKSQMPQDKLTVENQILQKNDTTVTEMPMEKAIGFMNRMLQALGLGQEKFVVQGQNLPLEARDSFFRSDSFYRQLEKAVKEKWSLTPEEVSSKEKVVDFYDRLAKQVTQLSEMVEEAVKQTNVQSRGLQNLSQNLEFMNELNQVFQYVQLPLKFSENQAHGELYVYTNKKRLTQKEGTLTAFLHLDMEHIGPVNVHISLEEQKNKVTTRFEVTPDLLTFLSPYMGELERRLSKLGYQVKSSLSPLQETKTVLQQVEEQKGTTNVNLSYQTFDMRT
ncbi:MAG: hypothetical protein U0K95_02185 [Eubacterium sp.]|nr:hypothetical protein [Eubacterium sp.]